VAKYVNLRHPELDSGFKFCIDNGEFTVKKYQIKNKRDILCE